MTQPVVTMVIGGARSGKSELAERLATQRARRAGTFVRYVATGPIPEATAGTAAADDAWAARVAAHRARRPASWRTVEVGSEDLGPAFGDAPVVIVDSLGTWLAGVADFGAPVGESPLTAGLMTSLTDRRRAGLDTILVTEETGMGVHPSTAAGRAFRDALGRLNRRIADGPADEVLLVVAGRVLALGTSITRWPPGGDGSATERTGPR
jgi:adenosylcobinamide kinase/adenosylcobinamide-phosphate guanylyltransferase